MNGHIAAAPVSDTGDAGRSIKLRRNDYFFAKKALSHFRTQPSFARTPGECWIPVALPQPTSTSQNALRGSWPHQRGPESLVFRSRLKTGTASHEHFLFSEGRFSPDLRTWACQSLGHNPLISHRSIRAGFISGSEYWHALQTTGSESLRACQTRFLSLFYLPVLLTLLT